MKESESLTIAKNLIGEEVTFIADHSIGDKHHKYGFVYVANYGHIPEVFAPDGDELDAYYLGVDKPVTEAKGVVIAVVHRLKDDDDKLVIVPEGVNITNQEISDSVHFQEQWGDYEIIRK